MQNIMLPQAKIAIRCALGSAIRGTLTVREIAQNARMPSVEVRLEDHAKLGLLTAPMICVSSPNWFWNPPAK